MKYTLNQVYTFKLASGEELIAKVVAQQDNWLELQEPVSVAPGPQGLGLVPSLFTADVTQKIQLNIENIVISATTDRSVESKYIEATTGIRVPEKKLILG